MLHKLRRAMVDPERDPLSGEVEVDECYIGGPEAGLRGGRQHGDKALVVVAVEVRGTASGRVRLAVVPDASGPTLTGSSAPTSPPARSCTLTASAATDRCPTTVTSIARTANLPLAPPVRTLTRSCPACSG